MLIGQGLAFYASVKVLIYYFLVEKVVSKSLEFRDFCSINKTSISYVDLKVTVLGSRRSYGASISLELSVGQEVAAAVSGFY